MAGAPRGNTNALKHGFYSKRFTKEEHENLDRTRQDPLDEIASLRTHANRLNTWLLERNPAEYDEDYFTALNTLVNIYISIGTLLRTQAFLSGEACNVEKSIEEAVISLKERWILA
jgi:hypothetical protein